MSSLFEELDYRETPIGLLSLRRRHELALGQDVLEIKLGDEFLMSSLFTESEIALARLGLDAVRESVGTGGGNRDGESGGGGLDVAVGGLGLGYTARAVLDCPDVRSMVVVEYLDAVVDWHETGVLPLGPELTADPRCRFVRGDFFALSASTGGFDPDMPGRRFHAILLDIDHSPDERLDERSASFYRPEGLARLAARLSPGGVFGLWSNDPPDAAFTARLAEGFASAWAAPVTFRNPLQGRDVTQTVYLARTAGPDTEAETIG